jgi:hypothetical protein
MSRLSDYQDRMTLKQIADEEIDRLISHQIATDPELADLAAFLTELRGEFISEPSPAEVERLARSAGAIVRSQPASVRTSTQPQWPRSLLTVLRTSSAMAVSILALVVFSGLGLAANAAVPGDFLYGLDLAMEKVGIGAGSLQERTSEAQVLADRGQHAEAADHLQASIASYGDEATAEEVSQALGVLDKFINGNGTPSFTLPPASENAGPGNNNAGGNSQTNENTGPGNNNAGGNSENTGPDTNNASGNSQTNENTGPGNNNAGGNSENSAPGNGESTAPGNSENTGPDTNNAGGNSQTNENTGPGNNNAGGNSQTNENTGPGNNNAGGNGKGGN